MPRAPGFSAERDAILLQARRLHDTARGWAEMTAAAPLGTGLDRVRVLDLIADFDRLIRALAKEMAAIDADINKVSRQTRAILVYSTANRNSGAVQSAYRTPAKGEALS